VCASYSIEKLKREGYQVEGLFFNPNIHPLEEFTRRKIAVCEIAKYHHIEIVDCKYEPQIWFEFFEKYKDDKEGGRRCLLCIEFRLKKTFYIFKEKRFDYFTTTLTISPHKNSKAILKIGKDIGADYFLPIDFKKKDGFKKAIQEAKRLNLYRQNYCGCIYSKPY
jgi:predicted adenine nucleotide alpha hydrolase (AANH) superfamily ATPase